jgi:hypothetical protein
MLIATREEREAKYKKIAEIYVEVKAFFKKAFHELTASIGYPRQLIKPATRHTKASGILDIAPFKLAAIMKNDIF